MTTSSLLNLLTIISSRIYNKIAQKQYYKREKTIFSLVQILILLKEKENMSDFFDSWFEGLIYLFTDDLISFYAYITTVLAEIAFLWGFFPDIAIPFTVLLGVSIVNIIVCSWLKGMFEGIKLEVIISRAYVIIFGILFIVGFIFNWLANIILFAIPLLVTFLWIHMRTFQCTVFGGKFPKIVLFISRLFQNKVFWVISQIFVIGVPFAALVTGICLTGLPGWVKMLMVVIYAFCIPLIAYIEDDCAAENVFEIAYDHTWSEEYEQYMKKLDKKMQEDPEGAMQEVVSELVKMKEDVEKIIEQAEKENKK